MASLSSRSWSTEVSLSWRGKLAGWPKARQGCFRRKTLPSGADMKPEVAIIGGGICGLALALNLHRRGIAARVYETSPEVKELGVGITLLPHAMRELSALGLQPELEATGIENKESCFFTRFGQL